MLAVTLCVCSICSSCVGPQLQVVSTMSVGYEHIDLDECKKRNIIATNTPNVSTDSVAELTVSLLLLTSRRIKEGWLLAVAVFLCMHVLLSGMIW